MITGIRGLCNGIGPALFGLVFYVFHVDLEDDDLKGVTVTASTNHTTMEDPYGEVLRIMKLILEQETSLYVSGKLRTYPSIDHEWSPIFTQG